MSSGMFTIKFIPTVENIFFFFNPFQDREIHRQDDLHNNGSLRLWKVCVLSVHVTYLSLFSHRKENK